MGDNAGNGYSGDYYEKDEYYYSGVNSGEYQYDDNGNMKTDYNKIVLTEYNDLNMPEVIRVYDGFSSDGEKIEFLYDAAGNLLNKTVRLMPSNAIKYTEDYVGSFVYTDNVLSYIITPEGRAVKTPADFDYQYALTDHTGNVRVVFHDNGSGAPEVLQERHYYPFVYPVRVGRMEIASLNYDYNSSNPFLFSGKALHSDNGLDWYYFGSRFYDPQLGRWHTQDPAMQFANPYLGIGNNPVNYVDPDGEWILTFSASTAVNYIDSALNNL